jgi:hypothetical protein
MTNEERIELQRRLIANLGSLRQCAVLLGDIDRIADLDAQLEAANAKLAELENA